MDYLSAPSVRLKAKGAARKNPTVTHTRLSSSRESGLASSKMSDIATGIRSLEVNDRVRDEDGDKDRDRDMVRLGWASVRSSGRRRA